MSESELRLYSHVASLIEREEYEEAGAIVSVMPVNQSILLGILVLRRGIRLFEEIRKQSLETNPCKQETASFNAVSVAPD